MSSRLNQAESDAVSNRALCAASLASLRGFFEPRRAIAVECFRKKTESFAAASSSGIAYRSHSEGLNLPTPRYLGFASLTRNFTLQSIESISR